MKKSVLVTGGAGYIGSHVALALLEAGERVIVLDNLSTGSYELVPKGTKFFKGGIEDRKLVERIIREYGVEGLVHLAGFVVVEESENNPPKYYRNNDANARILFNVAARCGTRHIIASSTAMVYGNAEIPMSEDVPLKPINHYARSKARAERGLQGVARRHNLKYVTLRYFNVAGGGYPVRDDPTHLIRTALLVALGKKDHLKVFGTDYSTPDGTCIRDYIHVVDVAQAHVDALQHLRSGGESHALNVGYGHGYSVLEVAQAVERVVGVPVPLRYAPRRPGDSAAIIANPQRIQEILRWKPRYNNLDTIIEHELNWVRSQLKS